MEFNFVQDMEIVLELMGLSKEAFAQELGVSRMTVNNWLTGKKEAGDKNIASFYEYTFRKGIRLNLIKEQLYREETEPRSVLLLAPQLVQRQKSAPLWSLLPAYHFLVLMLRIRRYP